jgi:hypothetical protein
MVLVEGRETLVEPHALEFPVTPCPVCVPHHDAWKRQPICQRCEGRGVVGENTPWSGVAVGERGEARRWSRHSERQWGEGIYALHVCVCGR